MRATRRGARPTRPGRQPDPGRWRDLGVRLRRVSLFLGGVIAAGGVIAGGIHGYRYVMSPDSFPLQAVRFDSRLEYVRESDLRTALDPLLGTGFWGLDVKAIRESLEALEWVRTARVRRIWPGTLQVMITEHEAVARWNDRALLASDDTVFRPDTGTWPDGLPVLSGPAGRAADVGERYRRWRDALNEAGHTLHAVRLDARGSWQMELESGALLELGRQETDARLDRFIGALEELRSQQDAPLVAVDLRYPNGFAVRWAQGDRADN